MLKYLACGLIGLGMGIAIGGPVEPAMAAYVSDRQKDLNTALETTPQGILVQDYFDMGTSELSESAVVASRNPSVANTEAVRITNNTYQVGAVWSKPNRKFNLNHNQTLSMWLYFGNQFEKAADGMAFVLQNDSRGKGALTNFPSDDPKRIQGETLGVWGVDDNTQLSDDKTLQRHVAQSAIKNSWALEFDTHLNTDNTLQAATANSFDLNPKRVPLLGPHIASNYPGEPQAYLPQFTDNWLVFKRLASIDHQGILPNVRGAVAGDNKPNYNFLSNGQWHHVTLAYETASKDAPTGKMTYSFDDRQLDTAAEDRSGMSATVELDKRKIDPDGTGSARWGFTGATGAWDENNLVVFDQIPDLVDSDAAVTLSADGKPVADGGVVPHGASVKLDYRLRYLNGSTSWQNIAAKIKLPEKVTFQSVTITNADGSQDDLPMENVDLSTGSFAHQLTRALSEQNPWVTLSFKGRAQTQSGHVPEAISTFSGTEAATQTTTPEFTIDQPEMSLKILTDTANPLDNAKDVILTGQVDFGKLQYRNSELHITSKLNGIVQNEQPMSDSDQVGTFKYILPANILHTGDNDLVLTLVATDGLTSQPLKLNVSPLENDSSVGQGQVQFTNATGQVDFAEQLTGRAQDVFAQPGFSLAVADTRRNGSWTLQVQAEPLIETQSKQRLAGDLIYKTAEGAIPLAKEARPILQHTNAGADSVTNVTDNWQDSAGKQRGLFLHLSGGAVAGNYQGEILWSLLDAI
ncbi:lectin-like domain-containing protein [Levilactobacillus andaensis]|uniref:lectin-like domain-containing protein n=1 Tax=Levilactobacillus andaensis TaxID=2799570 RepID=UPI001940F889|nr:hypothetical protein [Levilactobacillus andaensis]